MARGNDSGQAGTEGNSVTPKADPVTYPALQPYLEALLRETRDRRVSLPARGAPLGQDDFTELRAVKDYLVRVDNEHRSMHELEERDSTSDPNESRPTKRVSFRSNPPPQPPDLHTSSDVPHQVANNGTATLGLMHASTVTNEAILPPIASRGRMNAPPPPIIQTPSDAALESMKWIPLRTRIPVAIRTTRRTRKTDYPFQSLGRSSTRDLWTGFFCPFLLIWLNGGRRQRYVRERLRIFVALVSWLVSTYDTLLYFAYGSRLGPVIVEEDRPTTAKMSAFQPQNLSQPGRF
ncbi:hypothetical protein HO173_003244 [Letharia columbiana]|uniref:Uncharacterized protein n=1 Tax=Letharia columbiana TaxID=112416 RepID=A0A8H6L7V0_9LECA|nr:uncharacterized protein HO173_003244 [Letharia columbiana]KAF6238738.1 hypothetical protein HO173_003244 [Letharia columbiana]